ncbi:MAG TPA: TolC family protein [Rubrivivax sp.]|jgi:outer membrane protein TolC|nr:TolC family protein [Rubrivivax sp.]
MSQLSVAVAAAFAVVASPPFRSAGGVFLCLALSGGLLGAPAAAASCVDEDRVAAEAPPVAPGEPRAGAVPADPRATLSALVQDAVARSHAVGASKLLSEAALDDVEEARAARAIQASVGGGVGPGGSRTVGVSENSAAQVRATLNVSQLLYDGGRSDRLADWRAQLAESARWGLLTVQEQLALSTVALSLERSRYRMTAQVFRGHVRKMSCLVEALDTIVRTDRGRASELVQAKKSMQQAELALSQTQHATRQVEVRLRRLVGDGLPSTEGLSTVFGKLPDLAKLVADVERSREINQLDAQAAAARRYADAVAAGGKPQLSWNMAGNAAAGAGGSQGSTRSGSYSVGLTVNVPLLSPGIEPASNAARKRAQAAQLQRADALETRRFRVAEVHEQAQAALDRAQRVAEVLRNSEQVRNFTLQQWQQLGKRSLFDVMGAESDHFNLRVAYVNALHDVQQLNAQMLSLGTGVSEWLR